MSDVMTISDRVPRGHRAIADQMKRSATSVVPNIAEGANRRGAAESRQLQHLGQAAARSQTMLIQPGFQLVAGFTQHVLL